ncbi:MAG: S-layer homology domain-containing protein [bacterium]
MKKTLSLFLTLTLLLSLTILPGAADEWEGKTILLVSANLRGDLDAYAPIAALKAEYVRQGAEVLLLDAGNYLHGSAAANSTMGAAVYDMMEAVGYNAVGLGLYELVYGEAATGMLYHGNYTRYYSQKLLQLGTDALTYNQNRDGSQTAVLEARTPASFRAVATNLTASDKFYAFLPSVVLTTAAGLRVGVVSYLDSAAQDSLQDGLVSAIGTDYTLPQLDCDLTLCLTTEAAVPHDLCDITADASDGKPALMAWSVDNATHEITPLALTLPEGDPAIAALAEEKKAAASPVVGHTEVILNAKDSLSRSQETNFGDLVTDALLWYAETYMDGLNPAYPLAALQNGGNIDQFLYPGPITELDLLRALPFSPMGIGAMELTGAQLLEVLEAGTSPSEQYGETQCPGFAQISGLSYAVDRNEDYDGGEAYGKFYRADSVTRVSAAIDEDAIYTVIADNYIMNGSDTYYIMTEAREAGAKYVNNGNGVKTRDIVGMYLQTVLGGTVGEEYASPQGRIAITEKSPFSDVQPYHYYYRAILWAAAKGVAVGSADGAFDPYAPCTRAQFVTFLWRLAGSPAPQAENPFTDVSPESSYEKAIRWAVEEGIAAGMTPTHFEPGSTVTRAQAVTFLYRYAKAEPVEAENPFTDVDSSRYYAAPILWAFQKGITNGNTPTTFGPDASCLRCQAVTFLWNMTK